MKYNNIYEGKFIKRPNRFIAHVEIDGVPTVCHVKNTGRCKELLSEGATVYLEKSDNPERKTLYDLVAVMKGNLLVNMDSQAPNKVFGEWAKSSGFFGENPNVKPEVKFGNSRFDFYIESEGRRIFAEIKGVTLEDKGICSFPDAPTERGLKHIEELCRAVDEGYESYIFFIIQMEGMKLFTPNRKTHPEFADALISAKNKGVHICALDCKVTPDTLNIRNNVEIKL